MRWTGLLVMALACSTPREPRPTVIATPPRPDAAAATASTGEWEAAWLAARACLLGAPPAAADLDDALAARRLAREDPDCTPLIARAEQLVDAAPPKEPANAVFELRESLGTLALNPGHAGAMRSYLPRVDQALAEVRLAAGLPPATLPAGPALPVLRPEPPIAGTAAMFFHGPRLVDHVVTSYLMVGGNTGWGYFVARAPDNVQLIPQEVGAIRALPTGTWGAEARGRKVVTGDLDARGRIVRPVTAATGKERLSVSGALGDGPQRAILVGFDTDDGMGEVMVVRSSDGGKTWSDPTPFLGGARTYILPSPGRDALDVLAVAGIDGPTELLWQRLADPGAERPSGRRLPGKVDPRRACLALGASWWLDPDGAGLRRADDSAAGAPTGGADLRAILACDTRAAVVVRADRLAVCRAAGCEAQPLPGDVADVDGDGAVSARQVDHVVAVWRGGQRRLYHVDEDTTLLAVVVWRERVRLLLQDRTGVSFTPLP